MTNQPAYDPTEIEQAKLNTGRLMRANADVVLPLIQDMREQAISTLIWKFKEGKRDEIYPEAAKLATLEDMRTSIITKIKAAEVIERKIHGGQGL